MTAWRPAVTGIVEVFHADFAEHAYPSHTHDTWTLLIIDEGMVRYDLDRHEHGALQELVTLLPPHVPHDGRSVTRRGFRKRVLYLDPAVLPEAMIGPTVDHPGIRDPDLHRQIDRLHGALALSGKEFEAQSRFALVSERLDQHLAGATPRPNAPKGIAASLRELLDESVADGIVLQTAADLLQVSPAHLIRSFAGAYGIPPHRYLVGRRIDLARRLLLAGQPAAEVAADSGFHDQAHLTRHFRQMLGTTPGRYARSR